MNNGFFNDYTKFIGQDFYLSRSNAINDAIEKYDSARNDDSVSEEDFVEIRNRSESLINKLIVESGASEDGSSYFSIENEFYREDELDAELLKKFNRNIICNFGLDQSKLFFYPTTSTLTPITEKCLKNGETLSDLYPAKQKRFRQKEKNEKLFSGSKADLRLVAYADGKISDKYNNDSARFNLVRINDQSGMDWSTKYNPNFKVKKEKWGSGFNKDNIWEEAKPSTGKKSPLFGNNNETDSEEQLISFIPVADKGSAILLDSDAILQFGILKSYYSLTGLLYAALETDVDETVENVLDQLEKNGINELEGIVVADTSDETKEYYKSKLKGFVTEKTVFYKKNDPAFIEKNNKIKADERGHRAGELLIESIEKVVASGSKGDSLYQEINPGARSLSYSKNLNVINNEDDRNYFLNHDLIKGKLSNSAINKISSMDEIDDPSNYASYALQNLLMNFDSLFKHTDIENDELINYIEESAIARKADLSKGSRNISKTTDKPISKKDKNGDSKKFKTIKIAGEKNFVNYISDIIFPEKQSKVDLTYFRNKSSQLKNALMEPAAEEIVSKTKKVSADNSNEDSFYNWANQYFDKNNLDKNVLSDLKTNNLTVNVASDKKERFFISLKNIFNDYETVRENTGITPKELILMTANLISGRPVDERFRNKRILFERELESIINEAAVVAPEPVVMNRKILKVSNAYTSQVNLFDSNDLDIFVASGNFSRAGISEDDAAEVVSILNNGNVPVHSAAKISQNIINELNHRRLRKDAKHGSFVSFVRNTMKQNKSATSSINLNSETAVGDLMKSNLIKESGLNESQLRDLSSHFLEMFPADKSIAGKPVKLGYNFTETDLFSADGAVDNDESFRFSGSNIIPLARKEVRQGNKIKSVSSNNSVSLPGKYKQITPVQTAFAGYEQPAITQNTDVSLFNDIPQFDTSSINKNLSPNRNAGSKLDSEFNESVEKDGTDLISNDRMKQIEENYRMDKKMLAKDDSAPSSAGSNKEPAKTRNISKTFYSVVNEAKGQIDNE